MDRLENLVMILSDYDIEYVDHKEIKGQVIDYQLVDVLMIVDHPLMSNFLDEFIFAIKPPTTWKLYFDDPIQIMS